MKSSKYDHILHNNKIKYEQMQKQKNIMKQIQYQKKCNDNRIIIKIENVHSIRDTDMKIYENCIANKTNTIWDIILTIVAHTKSITADEYYKCIRVRLFYDEHELYYDENVHTLFKKHITCSNNNIFNLIIKIDEKKQQT